MESAVEGFHGADLLLSGPRMLRSLRFSLRVAGVLLIALPALRLHMAFSRRDRTNELLRVWARRVVRWAGCPLTVDGLERLPRQATLIVANHSSALDSVILLAAMPGDVRFVANHMAATRPLVGRAIRNGGHLVVNRGSAESRARCARAMIGMLQAGTSLIVFPEGTRSTALLLPLQAGPFRVAAAAGCPVTPVAITGTRTVLPRRFRLLQPAAITVTVLAPIVRDGTAEDRATELRDRTARALSEALAGAPRPVPPASVR